MAKILTKHFIHVNLSYMLHIKFSYYQNTLRQNKEQFRLINRKSMLTQNLISTLSALLFLIYHISFILFNNVTISGIYHQKLLPEHRCYGTNITELLGGA